MSKKRRKLWLRITGTAPVSRSVFWGRLRQAVREEDYSVIPESWGASIQWRNKEDAEWKSDDFGHAMEESAQSSAGWSKAVHHYLDRMVARLPQDEQEGITPALGQLTQEERFRIRSEASKQGWRTRRRNFARRSAAALKGWETRRSGR